MLRDLELFVPFPDYKSTIEWERAQCRELQPTLHRLKATKHALQTLAEMMEIAQGPSAEVDEYVRLIQGLRV